jgi:hypothetical protein
MTRSRAILVFFSAIVSVQAQPFYAISGTVRDPSGVRIGGAAVELLGENGGLEQTTTTYSMGTFQFAGASPGVHFIEVKQPGFSPVHRLVRVGTQPLHPVRIVLSLAARREEVTVQGEAAGVTIESAANRDSIAVTQHTLQSIPVFDMDYVGTLSNFLSQGDSQQVV